MTQILLTRHAQSEWNAVGRWQGQADPPLSDLGRTQARLAAARVGAVDAIISSDLQRAVETAHIIATEIGVGPVLVDPDLRERDAGEWSGLTRTEIERDWPGYLAEHRRPPGFESDESLAERTAAALGRLVDEHDGAELLVITHGGIVYGVEREAGLPFERLPNLAGRWVSHAGGRPGKLVMGDRVLLVDDDLITTVPAQI
jgi:probable phosphoglycerate mutase